MDSNKVMLLNDEYLMHLKVINGICYVIHLFKKHCLIDWTINTDEAIMTLNTNMHDVVDGSYNSLT